MDATAKLLYGIDYGDEGFWPTDYTAEEDEDGEELELEDKILSVYFPEIAKEKPTDSPANWQDKTDPSVIAYYAYWDKKWEALKQAPHIDETRHGSDGYSCKALYIEESYTSVDYGDSKDFGQKLPETNPTWRDQIKEFCDKMGIEFKEPQWLLLAYWG